MTRENTILFVCDVQDKKHARLVKQWKSAQRTRTQLIPPDPLHTLLGTMNYNRAIATVVRALEFSKIIGVPILKSEHVFKNEHMIIKGKPITRGETQRAVQGFFNRNQVPSIRAKEYQKTTISMIDDQIRSEIVGNSPESIFFNTKFAAVVGLETHLAVWKTCEDLKNLGIMPVILVDGVCSARDLDSDLCLKMMKKDGMVLMTLEMWAHKFGIEDGDDGFGEILELFEAALKMPSMI